MHPAHILPGLLLLAIPFVSADEPYVCVILMTLAFGFNGALAQSTMANYHDLGPTCAASSIALVNSVSATCGIISPLIVAYFTSERVREYVQFDSALANISLFDICTEYGGGMALHICDWCICLHIGCVCIYAIGYGYRSKLERETCS